MLDQQLAIGAVAQRSGMAVSAIRFYEQRGLIMSTRTAGGQRRFDRAVLRRIAFIQVAQRVGLRLDDIGAALAQLPRDRGPTGAQWAQLSVKWRPAIDERIRLLQALRDDLDGCIGCGCLSLQVCRLRNPDDQASTAGAGPQYLQPRNQTGQSVASQKLAPNG